MMTEDGSNQGFTLGDFRVIPGRGRSQKARRFDQAKMDIAFKNAFEYCGDHDEPTIAEPSEWAFPERDESTTTTAVNSHKRQQQQQQ